MLKGWLYVVGVDTQFENVSTRNEWWWHRADESVDDGRVLERFRLGEFGN